MNHWRLAEAWHYLEARQDENNVVREVLGRYYMSISARSTVEVDAITHQVLIWLKAILDHQRLMYQYPENDPLRQNLLHKDLTCKCVFFALELGSRVVEGGQQTLCRHENEKLAAHVLLAGLRVLHLSKPQFTSLDSRRCQVAIAHWLENVGGVTETENILEVSAHAVKLITPGTNDFVTATSTAPAPGVDFPSQRGSKVGVHGVINELLSSLIAGETRDFWRLYDYLWAFEAAMVKLCREDLPKDPNLLDVARKRNGWIDRLDGLSPAIGDHRHFLGTVKGTLSVWCSKCSCLEISHDKARLDDRQRLALMNGEDLMGINIRCPHPGHATEEEDEALAARPSHISITARTAKRITPFDSLHEHLRDNGFKPRRDPLPLLAENLVPADQQPDDTLPLTEFDGSFGQVEPCVEQVASTESTKVISSDEPVSTSAPMEKKRNNGSGLRDRPKTAIQLANRPVRDVAMSPSDRTVAVALGGSIELYDISGSESISLYPPRRVDLCGPTDRPESQILQFHPVEDNFAVLTLHAKFGGDVSLSIDAFDFQLNPELKRSGDESLKIANLNERYLTSIQYVRHLDIALVALLANSRYRILHGKREGATTLPSQKHFPHRLQDASVLPDNTKAVLLDGNGKLWSLDLSRRDKVHKPPEKLKDDQNQDIRVGPRHMPDPRSLAKIATPSHSCVHVFWIDRNQGTPHLETITAENVKVPRAVKLTSISHDSEHNG
ncbi:MAG: hypothetical protein Q9162_001864 [Coniocarpon cinnabarinum]